MIMDVTVKDFLIDVPNKTQFLIDAKQGGV